MESSKIHKHNDVLHAIAKASEAIRRKHKMIKESKDTSEQVMGEMFKPLVTPLQELVDTSKQQQQQQQQQRTKQEIKTERGDISMKNENKNTYGGDDDDDDEDGGEDDGDYMSFDGGDNRNQTIVARDGPATSTPVRKTEDPAWAYLKMLEAGDKKDLDTTYGVRKLQQGMMIGDSQIKFYANQIYVGDKRYEQTPGLLELLFKKSPDVTIVNGEDEKNYRKIVMTTHVHRKHYKPDRSIRENVNSAKYMDFIAGYVERRSKRKKPGEKVDTPRRAVSKSGKGLPQHKIARKEGQEIDYVHWNDPNEIVDRLRLLMASQAAGNTSHSNEIVSIIEELREEGFIY